MNIEKIEQKRSMTEYGLVADGNEMAQMVNDAVFASFDKIKALILGRAETRVPSWHLSEATWENGSMVFCTPYMRATVSSASDVNVDVQGAPVATFSRKNLMKVIRDAAEFVYAPESGRPALGRVWVERENGIWSFFASDAHQIVRLNVPVEADDFQKHVCFLPTSLLAFLKKTSFEQVTWHETEDRIVLKAGRDVFVFYQTDAGIKPPPFHNVLPASDAPKCKVSVEKLDAAIRVALTFSRKKAGYPVRLTACDDTLIVFAQDKDKGDAEVNVPIVSSDWNFPDQTIHVNGQYLRKALRMARSKSMVTLSKQPNSIIIALTLNSPDLLYCVAEMVKDD